MNDKNITFDYQAQFELCKQWNDAEQWDALGMVYYQHGYYLNAFVCFKKADACRVISLTPAPLPPGEGKDVAVETEAM